MKKLNIFILSVLLAVYTNMAFPRLCKAQTLAGNVNKEEFLGKSHIVVDEATGNPIAGAEISIPSAGIYTRTNNSGEFRLGSSFKGPMILSVQADGYKPFSLTLKENDMSKPFSIAISKLLGNETVIDKEIHHLGDDNFSEQSANADDFKLNSESPDFFKEFYIGQINPNSNPVLKIGSIIGLDTKMAHRIDGQRAIKAFSSPMQIYINSKKLGNIRINGDNQEISLPRNILKQNSTNTIRIVTGINQQASSKIDYDDMEFMNLLLVF